VAVGTTFRNADSVGGFTNSALWGTLKKRKNLATSFTDTHHVISFYGHRICAVLVVYADNKTHNATILLSEKEGKEKCQRTG